MSNKHHRLSNSIPLIGFAFLLGGQPLVQAETDYSACEGVTQEMPRAECHALVDLYHSTNGSNWTDNTNWNEADTPHCDWANVICSHVNHGNVTSLFLKKNNLDGSLPASLGDLVHLETLSLYSNKISGSIPDTIGNLTKLKDLWLYDNQLSGTIPASIGNLVNLLKISLSKNQLHGSLPEGMTNWTQVEYLSVHNNHLSGQVDFLQNLTTLKTLWLYNNDLTGDLYWMLKLTQLEKVSLSYNEFSGDIPEELGNKLNMLVQLGLHNNELCNNIPKTLMKLHIEQQGSREGLQLQRNHLNTGDYDQELTDWLDGLNLSWDSQRKPCSEGGEACLVYAVHDEGLNNSHFFIIDPEKDFAVEALGDNYPGADIEALAIHPATKQLYASSGDDTANGYQPGFLYRVKKSDGNLTYLCSMGLGEVSALAFHPTTHILWVWADHKGLFTIDNLDTCQKTNKNHELNVDDALLFKTEVEALSWSKDGNKLYGTIEGAPILYYSNFDNGEVSVCNAFPAEVEGLETLPNGELLFSQSNSLHAFNPDSCSITNTVTLSNSLYNDIEGMAWPCSGLE